MENGAAPLNIAAKNNLLRAAYALIRAGCFVNSASKSAPAPLLLATSPNALNAVCSRSAVIRSQSSARFCHCARRSNQFKYNERGRPTRNSNSKVRTISFASSSLCASTQWAQAFNCSRSQPFKVGQEQTELRSLLGEGHFGKGFLAKTKHSTKSFALKAAKKEILIQRDQAPAVYAERITHSSCIATLLSKPLQSSMLGWRIWEGEIVSVC
jgi:hypothetical protein